jgi:hypothetical protein
MSKNFNVTITDSDNFEMGRFLNYLGILNQLLKDRKNGK